ncbi:MAG: mechanosensitive ion channel family protein [Chloroflexota bacterium]|nr:mechanosensitive ion channel family protein [Chloroflexota bacterium]
MNPTDIYQSIASATSTITTADFTRNLLLSVLIIVGLVLLRRLAMRYIYRQDLKSADRYRWTKLVSYAITGIGIVAIGAVWFSGIGGFATILGLILAGLIIALNEPLTNITAWAYILWRKPFVLGDRVALDDVRGDVADQDPLTFSLLEVGAPDNSSARQLTGKVVHVPNRFVFSQAVKNESEGFEFIWHEVPVVITFESDWEKAKSILTEIVEKHAADLVPDAETELEQASSKLIFATGNAEPAVYTRVVDHGIEMAMRFVAGVRRPRQMEQAIWEDVLRAFAAEPDIALAYPTQRFFRNPDEGKPGVGGPPVSR